MKKMKLVENEMGGYKPICGHCGTEYPDAEFGDVKNYPDDGVIAVFMECRKCGEESEHVFEWKLTS